MHDKTGITFAGGTLDRAAHLRDDTRAIDSFRQQKNSKAMLIWRGKVLIDRSANAKLVWLEMDEKVLQSAPEQPIFLGLQNGHARFACDISTWTPATLDPDHQAKFVDDSEIAHPALPGSYKFVDLRMVMADLSRADAGDAATAKGIFEWHRSHRFCACCGAASVVSKSGWQRQCPDCNRMHFPRTDPVVIMLVTSGNDVLLGRSPLWPQGMFSLLAGFMEPGETIAEAVAREVFEETSVQIGRVDYLLDQPWPFPSSLMIGCKAQALTRDIILDPIELEAALWVSREEVMATMDGSNPDLLPARKGSIARYLLDQWLTDTLN